MQTTDNATKGILLAIAACLLWSGNFIVARGMHEMVPPVTLAFLRWSTATVMLFLVAGKRINVSKAALKKHFWHLFWTSLTGVAIFNTLLYISGHYVSAINMALIGTTSSPVITFLLAAFFLKEKIPAWRMVGLVTCIAGILFLIARGGVASLLHLQFSVGDLWVLGAGLMFGIYNILVRQKPAIFPPITYLAITFSLGLAMLLPAMIIEQSISPGIQWNATLIGSVLYIGAGASVAAFFCWNAAIAHLGAARTSIFGNLIPVFSSIEAVLILQEKMLWYHWAGMVIVSAGLLLANSRMASKG